MAKKSGPAHAPLAIIPESVEWHTLDDCLTGRAYCAAYQLLGALDTLSFHARQDTSEPVAERRRKHAGSVVAAVRHGHALTLLTPPPVLEQAEGVYGPTDEPIKFGRTRAASSVLEWVAQNFTHVVRNRLYPDAASPWDGVWPDDADAADTSVRELWLALSDERTRALLGAWRLESLEIDIITKRLEREEKSVYGTKGTRRAPTLPALEWMYDHARLMVAACPVETDAGSFPNGWARRVQMIPEIARMAGQLWIIQTALAPPVTDLIVRARMMNVCAPKGTNQQGATALELVLSELRGFVTFPVVAAGGVPPELFGQPNPAEVWVDTLKAWMSLDQDGWRKAVVAACRLRDSWEWIGAELAHEKRLVMDSVIRAIAPLAPVTMAHAGTVGAVQNLVLVVKAATAANMRGDLLLKRLRARGCPIGGVRGAYTAELRDILMCVPEKKRQIQQWDKKNNPSE